MSDELIKAEICRLYKYGHIPLEQVLNELSNDGYCPSLVFDDDNHWALTFDGSCGMSLDDQPIDMMVNCYVAKNWWKPSIKEAVIDALNRKQQTTN